MATLTLQVDDELLARANAAASRMRHGSLESALLERVNELGSEHATKDSLAEMRRLFKLADEHGGYLEGGMPDSEERNAR